MAPYVYPKIIEDRSKLDLSWLLGRRIDQVEKIDYSWYFCFDDKSSIGTESPWRLVTSDGIVVTSEDDGHPFGLPAPVSAAKRVIETIMQSPVSGFELRERTRDLVLHFAGNVAIEFLNLSCGYDGWRAVHGKYEIFCQGGGQLAELKNE